MERLGDTWLYESGVQGQTPAGDRHLRVINIKRIFEDMEQRELV